MECDTDREFDLKMMALTVWGEARGESRLGQRAVAWVIRNRFEHPGWWSKAPGMTDHTIAAVCRSPWQFSCWNESDPNRKRLDNLDTQLREDYLEIRTVCEHVLVALPLTDPTSGADHYCTHTVAHKTKWAQTRTPIAMIGSHWFYRIGLKGK